LSFLQSWVLWGLPVVLLPVLIHLIHKRRHRVVEWGAMRFLLQGAKMSRGMQRLRHFLLLALRTLAVLGLVVGLGRPLAGGWLGGLGGGQPDTVIVLLDRSASMSRQLEPGGETKLAAGVARVASALGSIGASRLVVIDSVSLAPLELDSASDLVGLATARETDAEADVPAMLELAARYLEVNSSGRAELWILSDGEASDWRPDDGRWPVIAGALVALPAGVRVNVLNLTSTGGEDLRVRVERTERVVSGDKAELVLDLVVRASEPVGAPMLVPVALDVAGARSVVSVELSGDTAELRGHRVEVAATEGVGWGLVELLGDMNYANNRYYFTFGAGAIAETVIVTEDEGVRDVLRFAAEAPVKAGTEFVTRIVSRDEADVLELGSATLVLWQGGLPEGDTAARLEAFVAGGGCVVFLPPTEATEAEFLGCRWGPLRETDKPLVPSFWRTQDDLLRNGDDGTPLTLGELEIHQLFPILGDVTRLAGFEGGETLLARVPTAQGGIYMLATTPAVQASNLATQGVALVALVARGLEAALEGIGSRGQVDAGRFAPLGGQAELLSEASPDWLLDELLDHAGVAQVGDELVALNRSRAEDESHALATSRLAELLPGVDVSWVAGGAEETSLVEEVWRTFLMLLLVALLGEALLTITESSPRVEVRA
jgi:hypothetical protein